MKQLKISDLEYQEFASLFDVTLEWAVYVKKKLRAARFDINKPVTKTEDLSTSHTIYTQED
jgi:hypothetical protein